MSNYVENSESRIDKKKQTKLKLEQKPLTHKSKRERRNLGKALFPLVHSRKEALSNANSHPEKAPLRPIPPKGKGREENEKINTLTSGTESSEMPPEL